MNASLLFRCLSHPHRMHPWRICLLSLALVLLAGLCASATTYQVYNNTDLSNANTNMTDGDIANIHGGTYNVTIRPTDSGSSGSPITYQRNGTDAVYITNTDQDYGANLNDRSYIVIDGIRFKDTDAAWIQMASNSSHNIIQNCYMQDDYAAAWVGIFIGPTATYNQILNNTIHGDTLLGDPSVLGKEDLIWIHSGSYNLIEENDLEYAAHFLISMLNDYNTGSTGNVFRNNTLHNPMHGGLGIGKHSNVLIEGNEFSDNGEEWMYDPYFEIPNNNYENRKFKNRFYGHNAIQLDSCDDVIVRENTFDNGAIPINISDWPDDTSERNYVYNNTATNFFWGIDTDGTSGVMQDHVFKNNIFAYANLPDECDEWMDNCSDNPPPWECYACCSPHPRRTLNWHLDQYATHSGNKFIRNVFFDDEDGTILYLYDEYAPPTPPASWEEPEGDYPSVFSDNLCADPATYDVTDEGYFLTTTTSAGSGYVVTVSDARYFYDGSGIPGEVGDEVQFEGQSGTATITEIDYDENEITLDTSMNWTSGLGFGLAYEGDAPDIGAEEDAPPAPVAAFSADDTTPAVNQTVTFTDSSTNSPTSWSWNFGDSATSTSQNPTHSYSSTGTKTVSLTATNSEGSDSEIKTDYITVGNPPVANFSGNPLSDEGPLTVNFTDSSTYNPTSWSWNFGDGSTSTSQNPSHTYTVAGYKTVTLTATNAYGSDEEAKNNYISVTSGTPLANFYANTKPIVNETVTFTDTSTGTPTSWSWNFGDGNSSTAQNPTHQYQNTGSYTIYLEVYNAVGTDYEVKTGYIVVGNPPWPNFSADDTTPDVNQTVTFTDSSTGTPTSWSWNFGDGSTSTSQNPTHQYASAGSYTVTLTATNDYGSDGETKTNYLTVGSTVYAYATTIYNPPWCGSTISGNLASIQSSDNSYLQTRADGSNAGGWEFFIDTPYTPAQVSSFKVEIEWHGSSASTTYGVGIYPAGGGSIVGIRSPATWSTTDAWFNTWSTSSVSTYMTNDGVIDLVLSGCGSATWDAYIDTVRVELTLAGGSAPVANFSADDTTPAVNQTVTFTDSSTNTPTSWSWNFGDGSTSTSQNPTHTYASTGTKTVSLRATNAAGYDDEVKTNYLTVGNAPVANFSADDTTPAVNQTVTFTDSSTNTPTSWSWNFGDGSTSTAQNPTHQYTSAGTYTVTLTATNAYGQDGETKTNYLTVSSGTVYAYATTIYNPPWCGSTISGNLASIQSSDNSYLQTRADGSNAGGWEFFIDTPYTPAQVSSFKVEIEWHGSSSSTTYGVGIYPAGGGSIVGIRSPATWSTTDAWFDTWSTSSVSTYMTNDGVIDLVLSGCDNATFDTYIDAIRVELTLN